jgi:nitroreductase
MEWLQNDAQQLLFAIAVLLITAAWFVPLFVLPQKESPQKKSPQKDSLEILESIRARRSVFPRDHIDRTVSPEVMKSLIGAAQCAPFHGSRAPWRFVVLGKQSMREMQHLTLEFYDTNWRSTGWANGQTGSQEKYQAWRDMTAEEIEGMWGSVSYMVTIVMQRQAGSVRLPEWEEMAATACAVQNIHIQASSIPGLACYWSSWHDAVMESADMHNFLGMDKEDKCMGVFIVAACEPGGRKDVRQRDDGSGNTEWRG